MDTLTGLDEEMRVILDHPIPCDGPSHAVAKGGHHPEQAASWLIGFACGHTGFSCDGWVQDTFSGPYSGVECNRCLAVTTIEDMTYVPLEV